MSVAASRRDGCGKSQRSWRRGRLPTRAVTVMTCLGFIRFGHGHAREIEIQSSWEVGRRNWLTRGLCFSCHATCSLKYSLNTQMPRWTSKRTELITVWSPALHPPRRRPMTLGVTQVPAQPPVVAHRAPSHLQVMSSSLKWTPSPLVEGG
jgi:hypothetical protein